MWTVVGLGRLGLPVAIALDREGMLHGCWTRSATRAAAAQEHLKVPVQHGSLPGGPALGDIVALAVPDDRLQRLAAALALGAPHVTAWVHFSGARPAEALGGVGAAASLHPLCAMTGAPADLDRLKGSFCAVDGVEPALGAVLELATLLGGYPQPVPATARAAYHAAATLASNGVYALLRAADGVVAASGIASDALARGLAALAAGSAANCAALGYVAAATGPVMRGDVATVRDHVAALSATAPGALPLYRAAGMELLAISEARGVQAGAAAGIALSLNDSEER